MIGSQSIGSGQGQGRGQGQGWYGPVVTTVLPIDPLLPDVVAALRSGNRLILRAAPGAGKTTRVPAALLDAVQAMALSVYRQIFPSRRPRSSLPLPLPLP